MSCESEMKQNISKRTALTSGILTNLVTESSYGSKSANDSLSGLINLSLPMDSDYNKMTVNTIDLNDSSKIFYVLLVYPNPLYNRLAFYSKFLKCYLIDKSLNGDITAKSIVNNKENYLEVNESFIAKDLLHLNRTSLYKLSDTSADLVFRTFTLVKDPYLTYTQKITSFSPDSIRTEINSTRYGYKKLKDIFTYDQKLNQYESSEKIFDGLVRYKLNQLNNTITGNVLKETNSNSDSLRSRTIK
jgi:hypothetical protein